MTNVGEEGAVGSVEILGTVRDIQPSKDVPTLELYFDRRVSDALNIQGATQVYQRVHTHKASGERMQTVVMEWMDAANTANFVAARAKLMQRAAGGKGTDGLFPPRRR